MDAETQSLVANLEAARAFCRQALATPALLDFDVPHHEQDRRLALISQTATLLEATERLLDRYKG